MHKEPCLKFLSNDWLGISVFEASGPVSGYLVRGIWGKSDVEMRGGLNSLRIVSGGRFDINSTEPSYSCFRDVGMHHDLYFFKHGANF